MTGIRDTGQLSTRVSISEAHNNSSNRWCMAIADMYLQNRNSPSICNFPEQPHGAMLTPVVHEVESTPLGVCIVVLHLLSTPRCIAMPYIRWDSNSAMIGAKAVASGHTLMTLLHAVSFVAVIALHCMAYVGWCLHLVINPLSSMMMLRTLCGSHFLLVVLM